MYTVTYSLPMSSSIYLPVTYQGQQLEFAFRLIQDRRRHMFSVLVDNVEVIYERKPDGRYGASIAGNDLAANKRIPEYDLLEKISDVLCSLQNLN